MSDKTREHNLAKIRGLGENVRKGGGLAYTLDVDFVSERGEHYVGTIEFHRPTALDYIKMGTLKAKYLQQFLTDSNGNAVEINPALIDETIKFTAQMLATFKVVTDKCPDWFLEPEEIYDFDLLVHIYNQYDHWLTTFRIRSTEKSEGNSEATE